MKVPVLVLVGEHDEATPPPMSQELAAGLPQARISRSFRAVHMFRSCSRPMFLDAIGDFLPVTNSAPA